MCNRVLRSTRNRNEKLDSLSAVSAITAGFDSAVFAFEDEPMRAQVTHLTSPVENAGLAFDQLEAVTTRSKRISHVVLAEVLELLFVQSLESSLIFSLAWFLVFDLDRVTK